jgi:arginase
MIYCTEYIPVKVYEDYPLILPIGARNFPRSPPRQERETGERVCRADGYSRILRSLDFGAMNIQLLLVPYDSGQRGWRCGAGPEHLLRAGLRDHLERLGHVVTAVQMLEDDPVQQPAEIRTAFELARRLALAVGSSRAVGHFPLVLSGNCNTAIGTLGGLSPAPCATFWFDAHGDCNTPETTTTGFLDGMGLATAMGRCWHDLAETVPGFRPVPPQLTFLLGARDLDPAEADWLGTSPVTAVSVEQLPGGLPLLLERAGIADTVGYLHLDLDVLDPAVGRANYLPVPDGLSLDQLTGAIAAIRDRVPLAAATVASYSPEEDNDQGMCRAAFAAIEAIVREVPCL